MHALDQPGTRRCPCPQRCLITRATGSFDLTDNIARPGSDGRARTMLWWGRFDPDYARNRVLRRCLQQSAWHITDFSPRFSLTAAWEARRRAFENVDVVWVPCFRQRDIGSASGWCRQRGLPLFIDPLISAFDKQVNERAKFAPGSAKAQRLLAWERKLFALADRIIADTQAHADYFSDTLRIPADRIRWCRLVPMRGCSHHSQPRRQETVSRCSFMAASWRCRAPG